MANKTLFCGLISLTACLCCIGCSKDYLDPTQIGRFRPVPVVNVILDSLGVADEPEATYVGAEDPRPEDAIQYEHDYVLGIGDVVRISIYELRIEGQPFINDYIVTETGRISIPDVGLVRAAGLSETQLEEEIKDTLSPGILKEPSVSVAMMQSFSQRYHISGGGITRPGRYDIPRGGLRISEALAIAGGEGEFNVSNIYVTREVTGDDTAFAPIEEAESQPDADAIDDNVSGKRDFEAMPVERDKAVEPVERDDDRGRLEQEMLETISPYAGIGGGAECLVMSSSEMATAAELEGQAFAPDASSAGQAGQGRIEWVFEDGKWVPVRIGGIEEADSGNGIDVFKQVAPAGERDLAGKRPTGDDVGLDGYGWDGLGTGGTAIRVIKIPVAKLRGGDGRYDIIVRPGDRVTIPVDIIGEFFVMGNVNRIGAIPLTGRPITLKQAVSLAGGLNQLAWPKKVEVVRRIGKNEAGLAQEETVMVDLDKIARGMQPDFFIKPYDLVNVGTHGVSRYLAVLRNAFRATYGFGFVYDRNFATKDFGQFDNINLNRMYDETF